MFAVYFRKCEQQVFQRPGQLLLHFFGVRAGIHAHNQPLFDFECREFVLVHEEQAHAPYAYQTGQQQIDNLLVENHLEDKTLLFFHKAFISTIEPSLIFCRPSVMTLSPVRRPSRIRMPLPENPEIRTARLRARPFSTIHT